MYYQHCCGADQLFDLKGARKEMKKYIKKGPGNPTKYMLRKLGETEISNKTLLDIGGGIGAVQWYFHRFGAKKTTDIDASNGYLKVASDFAIEKGYQDKSDFIFGDFANVEQRVESHDYVTLDKVVCCYPDYQLLLSRATELCKDTLALTFPMRNLISRFLIFLGGMYFYFKKNPFRTYVHDPENIQAFIQLKGFEPVYRGISFPWHVQVYRRVND